jgi:hypothetical protein
MTDYLPGDPPGVYNRLMPEISRFFGKNGQLPRPVDPLK